MSIVLLLVPTLTSPVIDLIGQQLYDTAKKHTAQQACTVFKFFRRKEPCLTVLRFQSKGRNTEGALQQDG